MNNLVPPSSSRPFRTQSHWSYFVGQFNYSVRFFQVHLPRWMCDKFTFYHQFKIDTWRSKIEQKDREYSFGLWNLWKKNSKIRTSLTWPQHVLHGTSWKRGKCTKIWCIGSIYSLFNRKDSSSIKQDRTQSSFTTPSQLTVSWKLLWNLENFFYEKVNESPRPPPKISLRNDWMKELGSEVARQTEDNQPTGPNPNPINRTGRRTRNGYTFLCWLQEYQFVCWTFRERQRHRQWRRCRSR